MSKKKAPSPEGGPTRRERLQAELEAAIAQIGEEGLVFLLEQANVLLHNARVEELEAKRRARGASAAEAEAPEERKAPGRPAVDIEESADRKTFFLTVGGQRKVLSLQEMQQVVRVCHGAESASEAARRLYMVLSRERRDILMDGGISGAGSPSLAAVVDIVRGRYRPRGTGNDSERNKA